MENNKHAECSKENAINFLLFSCVGITLDDADDNKKIVIATIKRAYRDAASHVLSIDDDNGISPELQKIAEKLEIDTSSKTIKEVLKEIALHYISDSIIGNTQQYTNQQCNHLSDVFNNEISYDAWHKSICEELFNLYDNAKCYKKDNKRKFTYGVAQKWVNMTMKYLYIINIVFDMCGKNRPFKEINSIAEKLHVPLDSYIFTEIKKDQRFHKYTLTEKSWSKISDYKKVYMSYQKAIRDTVVCPIDWESPAWIAHAKK